MHGEFWRRTTRCTARSRESGEHARAGQAGRAPVGDLDGGAENVAWRGGAWRGGRGRAALPGRGVASARAGRAGVRAMNARKRTQVRRGGQTALCVFSQPSTTSCASASGERLQAVGCMTKSRVRRYVSCRFVSFLLNGTRQKKQRHWATAGGAASQRWASVTDKQTCMAHAWQQHECGNPVARGGSCPAPPARSNRQRKARSGAHRRGRPDVAYLPCLPYLPYLDWAGWPSASHRIASRAQCQCCSLQIAGHVPVAPVRGARESWDSFSLSQGISAGTAAGGQRREPTTATSRPGQRDPEGPRGGQREQRVMLASTKGKRACALIARFNCFPLSAL